MEFKFPCHLIFCVSIKHYQIISTLFSFKGCARTSSRPLWISAPLASSGLQTNPWRNSLDLQYNPRPPPFLLTPLCNSQRHKMTFTVFFKNKLLAEVFNSSLVTTVSRNRAKHFCNPTPRTHPNLIHGLLMTLTVYCSFYYSQDQLTLSDLINLRFFWKPS